MNCRKCDKVLKPKGEEFYYCSSCLIDDDGYIGKWISLLGGNNVSITG